MSKKTCADCIHCQMCRWIDDMVKNSTCDFFEEWEDRPHGIWRIDGTDYEDGKITAIYVSHKFQGLDYARFVPDRPHGEWKTERFSESHTLYFGKCSQCGETCVTGKFCMWCGADMRKEGDEK